MLTVATKLILLFFAAFINGEYIPLNQHSSYFIKNIPTLHNALNNDKEVRDDNWSTTVPYWPLYPTRTVQVLDGNWYFGYGGDNFNLNQTIDPSKFELMTPNITAVPSAFDVKMPGIEGPRGTAFYRASFNSKQGKDILVYFSACAFYCQLYFDGKYIGDHRAGGYQPFGFHITQKMMNTSSESHQLFVVVDNRYALSLKFFLYLYMIIFIFNIDMIRIMHPLILEVTFIIMEVLIEMYWFIH